MPAKDICRNAKRHRENWFVIDAADLVLGRLASLVAMRVLESQTDLYAEHGLRRSYHYCEC